MAWPWIETRQIVIVHVFYRWTTAWRTVRERQVEGEGIGHCMTCVRLFGGWGKIVTQLIPHVQWHNLRQQKLREKLSSLGHNNGHFVYRNLRILKLPKSYYYPNKHLWRNITEKLQKDSISITDMCPTTWFCGCRMLFLILCKFSWKKICKH